MGARTYSSTHPPQYSTLRMARIAHELPLDLIETAKQTQMDGWILAKEEKRKEKKKRKRADNKKTRQNT
jgi:hypothetical protein